MKIFQSKWSSATGWAPPLPAPSREAQLVLVFGETRALLADTALTGLRHTYPAAHFMGCSTAGEICGTEVSTECVVACALSFAHTQLRTVHTGVATAADSFAAGGRLAAALPASLPAEAAGSGPALRHVFVLSDGLAVNGTELVRGLASALPAGVSLTGGLAGDGALFKRTLVLEHGAPREHTVAALGLYGDRLRIGFGSLGGWDSFGPERMITRSNGNVLHELDGKSALGLYKQYLGAHAKELPASGLLFPLSVRIGSETPVVRTILAVDEQAPSLTFAGDMPEGAHARLMKANFDRLIDGAAGAAAVGRDALNGHTAELAILISCVGRRLVLKQRVEEEVEAARDMLGERTVLTGFYSYGEISPFTPGAKCELHNQTMTITTFAEA